MTIDHYRSMTENGEFGAKKLLLGDIHAFELPHLCVQVWVMTSSGNMLHVRRRPTLYSPAGWDPIAIRAPVKADQNPLEAAMQQLRLDLGWRVARIELTHIPVAGKPHSFHEDKLPGDQPKLHRMVCVNYSLLLPEMATRDLGDTFTLNTDAISEVMLYRLQEFEHEVQSPALLEKYEAYAPHFGLLKAAVAHLGEQKKEARG